MVFRRSDGEPVAPEDVLTAEELAEYYDRHGWPRNERMVSFPARTDVPCDRTGRHPAHTYVATAKSGVDFHCPGVPS